MVDKLIDDKIDELAKMLKEKLPNTAVRFEFELTGSDMHYKICHKHPEDLKRDHISMRNIKGDFIQ